MWSAAHPRRNGWDSLVNRENGLSGELHVRRVLDRILIKGIQPRVVGNHETCPRVGIHIVCDSAFTGAAFAARKFVGPRRSSVFLTPPMSVLRASDYTTARQIAREQFDIGVSAQAYALAPKIIEVDEVAKADSRIIEVHPEVCFAAMGGNEVESAKTTWSGQKTRERLVEENGISIPSDLGDAGVAKPDDVLDAAAAAWTARRYAQGTANSLPPDGRHSDSMASVIWY